MNRAHALSPVVVAFVSAAALALAGAAHAHKRFAKKEGVQCKECHQNPEGSGPRNLMGNYYAAKGTLPLDRSPETLRLVQSTVDRWMDALTAKPPVIVWPHAALATLASAPAPTYHDAPVDQIARRMSLDLRATMATPDEVKALLSGSVSLESYVDTLLGSPEFESTFLLYHRDVVRPRTGDYVTKPSYSLVQQHMVQGANVYQSTRLPKEALEHQCDASARVRVSPWWDRGGDYSACAQTASTQATVALDGHELRCDTDEGQASGKCGCGPYLVWCYPADVGKKVIGSMIDEGAQLAMEVVREGLPYSTLLTSSWTMLDGNLEVFYASLNHTTNALKDPDAKRPPHRVERDAALHAGVLTTPMYLNSFYNGRRWAQRTFESFLCHDVYPDFDLLDDTRDRGIPAVPYRDSPLLEPSLTVTESRACAACHLQLDGLARVKDRWDPFGQFHMTSPHGTEIADAAWFEGTLVHGLKEFGAALGASEPFHDCVVTQLWQHLVGHRFTAAEQAMRLQLNRTFVDSNLNFKTLIRAITRTAAYRSTANTKLMTKEQYARAMFRATQQTWKLGDKVAWETFYDKVGGMDYRKIEARDRRPQLGHSLVQMKAAAETCDALVTSELTHDKRRFIKRHDARTPPTPAELDDALAALYMRALSRPYDAVPEAERQLMRALFHDANDAPDGYRAVCAAVFGSADFAVY